MGYIKNFLGADLPCIVLENVILAPDPPDSFGILSIKFDLIATGAAISSVSVDTGSVIYSAPVAAFPNPGNEWLTNDSVVASAGTYTVTIEVTDANANVVEFEIEVTVV